MKLPDGVNPAHVASKDKTRYVLSGVQFTGNLSVATNGRCLVAAIATREDDDDARDAIVPTRAVKAGIKVTKSKRTGRSNTAPMLPRLVINPKPEKGEGTVTVTDSQFDQTTVKEIDGNFPHIENVFTDPAKHTLKLGISASYLADIAKALGSESLVLHLDPDGFIKCDKVEKSFNPAIYITRGDADGRESIAILMPMRVPSDFLDGNRVIAEVAKLKASRAELQRLAMDKVQAEAEAAANAQPTTEQ